MKVKTLLAIEFLLVFVTALVVYFSASGVELPLLGEVTWRPRLIDTFGEGRLSQPQGVVIDEKRGKVYVADTGNHAVFEFERDGRFVGALPVKPGAEQTGFPYGLAISGDRLYVSDPAAGRIDVFDFKKDEFVTSLRPGPSLTHGFAPTGLAVAGNGDLVVADSAAHRVLVFDVKGNVKAVIGKPGSSEGRLAYPNDVAVQGDQIFVADSNNSRVQVFRVDGRFERVFTSKDQIALPRGIAVDPAGRLWVADVLAHKVRVLGEDGKTLHSLGDATLDSQSFRFPNDLALDGRGRVFVADREKGRVQVWTY